MGPLKTYTVLTIIEISILSQQHFGLTFYAKSIDRKFPKGKRNKVQNYEHPSIAQTYREETWKKLRKPENEIFLKIKLLEGCQQTCHHSFMPQIMPLISKLKMPKPKRTF